MAVSLSDLLTTVQQGVIALNNFGNQLRGSLTNIASKLVYAVVQRNYIINGAMMVSQENETTAGTTSGYYAVDMFAVGVATTGTVSLQQVASVTPSGSPNRLRVTVTAADTGIGATEDVSIGTAVEGYRSADLRLGTTSAQTVTVQFGCRGPAGTYCLSLRNGAIDRSYVAEFSITTGEANTDVVKSAAIALDQTGTWSKTNGTAIYLNVTLMCGTTFQTPAGSWVAGNFVATANVSNFMATNGNVFELFDVGLYQTTTAPTFQVPAFNSELSLCQRYWEKNYDYATAPGTASNAGPEQWFSTSFVNSAIQMGWSARFKVPKRTTPSIIVYSFASGAAGQITDSQTVVDLAATVDLIGETGFRAYSNEPVASTTSARGFFWTANARL